MGCEELVKCVRCVCVWLGAAWVDGGRGTGGVLDVCLCLGCGGVGGEGE